VSVLLTLTRTALWAAAWRSRRTGADAARALAAIDPHRAPAPAPASVRRAAVVTTRPLAGGAVTRVEPHRRTPGLELLYLPGGAYTQPMVAGQWWIVRELVRRTGASVTVAHYPLAPEHTVEEALPFLDAVHAQVHPQVTAGPGTRRLVLAGDSAGGGLALVQALRLRDAGGPLPDALLLLSPWVDVRLSTPDAWTRQRLDPTLRVPGLRAMGAAWAGGRSTADPLVSPVTADLTGLPPTTVVVGDRDVFHADVLTLVARARAAGADVELVDAAGGFHVYPGAFWTSEARTALDRLAARTLG
jgi:acetyl esterase/lipase